ncbi:MAG: Cupin domain protein [Gemmataceae bacterium]|nr:Cupin domain protein [Gemmataceae bacterium]
MNVSTGNLYAGLPAAPGPAEVFEPLWRTPGLTVERIISHGHTTPPGEWYDQSAAEWVVVLAGAARLCIEGRADLLPLAPGGWVFLPAGLRHRVEWTDPDRDTIWLAVHGPSVRPPHLPGPTAPL